MAKEVVGEADARSPSGGVVIFVGAAAAGRLEARKVQFFDTSAIDEGIWPVGGQILVDISDMAGIIAESAKFFEAQAKIQSEIGANLPIILRENGEIIGAVLVIKNAAAAETRKRSTLKKSLKIGQAADARYWRTGN